MQVSLREIKQALSDPKFRASLPSILKEDIQKYEQNPSCPCNLDVYRNVLKFARRELADYYPGRELIDHDAELLRLAENNWTIINCRIDELERVLRRMHPGRKQVALARYEQQVTVVINDLDKESVAGTVMENNWSVVNCNACELEGTMKRLPPGRKQVALARWQDEITIIVNELNLIF